MATCPRCLTNSRTDPTFELQEIFTAKEIGDFSLAGAQFKVSAVRRYKLTHRKCGWFVIGRVERDVLIAEDEVSFEE